MKIMVTGGAGYIGSHVVKALGKLGHELVIYDNLSTGHARSVPDGRLVVADLADKSLLDLVVGEFRPDTVIHFTATIQVEEQVWDPPAYYWRNVRNTMNLLQSMLNHGVRSLVFSSSAAVYGFPETIPVAETAPLAPINSYGTLKEMLENILRDLAEIEEFHFASLRYFNVAGADPDGELGQTWAEATHLITRALNAARGESANLSIFGTDYPTPDGTCIRDYIHVTDLAQAHVRVLERLLETGTSEVFNCGYGHGYSAQEVADAARRVSGINFSVKEAGRRPGNPAALFVDCSRLKNSTGWVPRHDDLDFITRSAWEWDKRLIRKRPRETARKPGQRDNCLWTKSPDMRKTPAPCQSLSTE